MSTRSAPIRLEPPMYAIERTGWMHHSRRLNRTLHADLEFTLLATSPELTLHRWQAIQRAHRNAQREIDRTEQLLRSLRRGTPS